MFSSDNRCIYRFNPLTDVICQLRFPEILSIQQNLPVDFQEAIRNEYPQYAARKESPGPKVAGTPGNLRLENPPQTTNYQFTSADGIWRINLTSRFISLTCTRYTCWEDFAAHIDKPLAAFIKIYKPAYFERVGLRYINFISRNALNLEDIPFSELISPCYLGLLQEEDVREHMVTQSSLDSQCKLPGGCNLKLHTGPGLTKIHGKPDPEVKFIIDMDLYMVGNIPVNHSAGAMQTLHSQSFSIFRGAITQKLHEAIEPEQQ